LLGSTLSTGRTFRSRRRSRHFLRDAFRTRSFRPTTRKRRNPQPGDLNLDGIVDASDYGVIDNYFQFPGTTGYFNGDFNFDGVIDASDYGLIDNAYQLQGSRP